MDSMLYIHQMVRVELPSALEDSARATIMLYLGHTTTSTTPTTVLRLLAPPTVGEAEQVAALVSHSPRLVTSTGMLHGCAW